jgi:ketopantoate reductase
MSSAPYTVFGAGSVGTTVAGLLAHAGVGVRIMGRGAVRRLRLEGDSETVEAEVDVVERPEGVILLCVHEPQVAAACAGWRDRTVVTFQNGVAGEAVAAGSCRKVIGGVWRTTCTLLEPGRVRFTRRGRVVVGLFPGGADEEVADLAEALHSAGLDVGVSRAIGRDKWLKLFANLTSAPNALVRPRDHGRPAFGALKRALLREALDVFRAASVVAESCDGRDLSPEAEIERQAAAGGRDRPVHNATWRRLARGLRPLERYHDTIVALAAEHGAEAPCNHAMLALLEAAREPECYGAEEVLAALGGSP